MIEEKLYRVVREPKGGPDAVFVGDPEKELVLLGAGNILSVMGYTARVATLLGADGATDWAEVIRRIAEKPLLPVTVLLTDAEDAYTALQGMGVTILPRDTDPKELARAALGRIALSRGSD